MTTTDPTTLTYAELLADHALLHRAVEAIQLQQDLPYVAALELIDDSFTLAEEASFGGPPPTLARALAAKGVDTGGFTQDIRILEAEANEAERKILSAEGLPVKPGGEVDGDVVKLSSAEQGARLLHDPIVQETAYLQAVEAGHAEPGDAGRAEFVELARVYAEAGHDYPATLAHQARQREIEVRQMAADNAEAARIEAERVERHGRDQRSTQDKSIDAWYDRQSSPEHPGRVQRVKPTPAFAHQVLNEADRVEATRARRRTEQPPKTRAPKLRRKR